MEFKYLVYRTKKDNQKDETVLAGFIEKLHALEYAGLMRSVSQSAGYHDEYAVREDGK